MRHHRLTTLLSLIIAFSLALAACGSAAGQGTGSELSTSYADALPAAGQLAAGTLKLEGSAQAVTAEQAGQLLPLWQGLQSLLTSSTSSDQEIQGVVAQIESSMTSAQIQTIAAMKLTQTDLTSLVQSNQGASSGATSSSGVQATRRAQSGGGDFGPPGGGGFVGGGPGGDGLGIGLAGGNGLPGSSSGLPEATLSADSRATAQAYSNQFAQVGVSPMTVRAVIQYLQSKTG